MTNDESRTANGERAERPRREFLKAGVALAAGLVAGRVPADGDRPESSARMVRIRTRPLTREEMYEDHDLAG